MLDCGHKMKAVDIKEAVKSYCENHSEDKSDNSNQHSNF